MRNQENQTQTIPILGIQGLHASAKPDLLNRLLHKPILEIIKDLEIEMNAKNSAYFFILESGNLANFQKYCNQNKKN